MHISTQEIYKTRPLWFVVLISIALAICSAFFVNNYMHEAILVKDVSRDVTHEANDFALKDQLPSEFVDPGVGMNGMQVGLTPYETSATNSESYILQHITYRREDSSLLETGIAVREDIFELNGTQGTVFQVCASSSTVIYYEGMQACTGGHTIVLSWDGDYREIDVRTYTETGGPYILSDVAFTEGMYVHQTTSRRDNARLVIFEYPIGCVIARGMCLDPAQATHVLMFKQGVLESHRDVSFDGSPEQLAWNPEGDRAVVIMRCREGCPDEMVRGISLFDTPYVVISTSFDWLYDEHGFLPPRTEWLSTNTVRVGDVTTTF